MTKLYRKQIEVQVKDNIPIAFHWRNRWYQVTSCMVKKKLPSRTQWWKEVGPPIYRCETRQGMACDLVMDEENGDWVLERVWD